MICATNSSYGLNTLYGYRRLRIILNSHLLSKIRGHSIMRIAKLIVSVKSQMKMQFFDPKEPIFIIGFLSTRTFAWNTNVIFEKAFTGVLPHSVKKTLSNLLNSIMCGNDRRSPFATLVRKFEPRHRKLLCSYPKVGNCFHSKIATDKGVAETTKRLFDMFNHPTCRDSSTLMN